MDREQYASHLQDQKDIIALNFAKIYQPTESLRVAAEEAIESINRKLAIHLTGSESINSNE